MRARYAGDLIERVLWTFLQGGLAVISIESFEIDPMWVPPIAAVLAVLKGLVARKIGSPYTAATLPASEETPAP